MKRLNPPKHLFTSLAALLFLSMIAKAEIIGAELAAQVIAPGKMKIILRTFHNDPGTAMTANESVAVFKPGLTSAWKTIQLEKQSHSNDFDYTPIKSSSNSIALSVTTVMYSALVDLPGEKSEYNITWSFTGSNKIIENVVIGPRQPFLLTATITDPFNTELNRLPMLHRIPALQLSSKTKTSLLLDIKEAGETDIVDVLLTTPMAAEIGNSLQFVSNKEFSLLKQLDFRDGYSIENPLGKSLSFDKMSKEMVFDQPAVGNYLVTLTISDYRNRVALSSHQAFFFIESVL